MEFEQNGIKHNEWITIIDNNKKDSYYNALFKKVINNYIIIELSTEQDIENIKERKEIEFITFYKDNVSYKFKSVLCGIKGNTAILSLPIFIKKEERRKFFRMDLSLTVYYATVKNDFMLPKVLFDYMQKKLIKSTSIDICGGGIKIYTTCEYNKGQKLYLRIYNEPYITSVLGVIVRSEKQEDNLYVNSIKFTDIHEKDRDELISYLFKQYR